MVKFLSLAWFIIFIFDKLFQTDNKLKNLKFFAFDDFWDGLWITITESLTNFQIFCFFGRICNLVMDGLIKERFKLQSVAMLTYFMAKKVS
jgi:hypothetical protein